MKEAVTVEVSFQHWERSNLQQILLNGATVEFRMRRTHSWL